MRVWPVTFLVGGCAVPEDNSAEISALADRVDALEADLTAANGRIAVLEGSGVYDTVSSHGDRIGALEGDVADLTVFLGQWITEPTTWTVGPGGDYATLDQALSAAGTVRVMYAGSLTLQLMNGSHTASGGSLNHLDGERLFLAGSSAASVTLAPANGLNLSQGHALGGISGITIHGADAYWGLTVADGASVKLDDVTIENFPIGVRAHRGGIVTTEHGGLRVENNFYGVWATDGGVIVAPGLVATANDMGAEAATGGAVTAFQGVFSNNTQAGVRVNPGGSIDVESATLSGNYVGAVVSGGALTALSANFAETGTSLYVEAGGSVSVWAADFASGTTAIQAKENSVVVAQFATFDASVGTEVVAETGAIVRGVSP